MSDDVLTFEELRRVQSRERESDTLQDLDEEFFDRARNYLEMKRDADSHLQGQEYRNARNIIQDILDMRQKKLVKLAFLSVKSNVKVENLLDEEEELFERLEEEIGSYRHDLQQEVFEKPGDVEAGGEDELDGLEVEEPEEVEDTEGEEPDEEETEEPETGVEEEGVEGESGEDVVLEVEDAEEEDEEGSEILVESGEEPESGGEEGDTGEESGEGGDGTARVKVQDHVPEFMGTDLEAYGPFEEGEEVEVPEGNAEVLEEQGKAERL